MLRLIAAGAAMALCLLSFPVAAYAQGFPTTKVERVSYADLNLSDERDVRELRRRVEQAILQVCDSGSDPAQAEDYRCITKARMGATEQMEMAVRKARLPYATAANNRAVQKNK